MKVTIEIDLDAKQVVPDPHDIARLTNPDWLASWWHISDVHLQANDDGENDEADEITDDEAREVLRLIAKHHDSTVGINWDVIDAGIDYVKEKRAKV
jgi:hypothetical protein